MMSNDWSIYYPPEEDQGEVNFDSHAANAEYILTVWQNVHSPNLFTTECFIKVLHPSSSPIVIALLNQRTNLILTLSDGEKFEASIAGKGAHPNEYVLKVDSSGEAWKRRKQRADNRNK
ncbi:MAG TPA: hypothetical protein VIN60_10015 [Anaerolineales bacterium]